jgi:UDP-3-O-[3-hydroxymyristoyl] glucosamine N-acyltransferase
MIRLFEPGSGWTAYDRRDVDVIARHHILIGAGVDIGEGVKIGDGALLGDRSSIGSHSIICGAVTIEDGVTLEKEVYIGRNAMVRSGSVIKNNTTIGERAVIRENAHIGRHVIIEPGMIVGKNASIEDGAHPWSIHFIGSRYDVTYWGEDRVQIGCRVKTIGYWLDYGAEVSVAEGYNEAEAEEYRDYLEIISRTHERYMAFKQRGPV